jgi:hypothetical protein
MAKLDYHNLDPQIYLTRPQAADFLFGVTNLPVTKFRLAKLAVERRGPSYTKFARRVMYRVDWLRAWVDLESRRQLRKFPATPRARRGAKSALA